MSRVRAVVGNADFKVRDGFEVIDPNLWEIVQDPQDVVELAGNTQGAGYLKISKSILDEDSETVLTSKFTVDPPTRLALGMSLSQRLNGQRFSIEMVGIRNDGQVESQVPVSPVINISNVAQTTTTLTVNTATPHGFLPNERIQIWGSPDSRANYGEVMVATVTSATQFTVTATPSQTIQSVTIGTTNGGFCQRVDPHSGANNALGVYWEGTSASNAKMISRSNKSPIYYGADTSLGSNHTNATQANTNNYADAWNPTYMLDLRYKSEAVIARSLALDSTSGYAGQIKRSLVIPEIDQGYKIRIRARNNISMTRPVARIVNSVKSASATATITTDAPHGLTTGDFIQIYGNRDQTNFANQSGITQVASVPNSTTITIGYGATATASTRGGSIIKVNGGLTANPIAQSIQTLQVTGGQMTLVGSASWSGIALGETVELHGVVDNSTGTVYSQFENMGLKVLYISTTTMILQCPAGMADQALLTVGGTVFKRTDLRLHLFRALNYTRQTVELDGGVGNTADGQEAIPVNAINFSTSMNGQSAAHDGAVNGNPIRIGARAVTANYTGVQNGDAADLISTVVGAIIQKPYGIPEQDWTFSLATPKIDTTDSVLKAAGAAGIKNYLTGLQVINTHATVATEFVVKDGATVIFRTWLPANMQGDSDYVFTIPLRSTAAAALNCACITTGANVYVNAQGYQAP
jgi:hypothetical protein